MAESYRIRLKRASPAFKKLHGRCVSRVAKARKVIMKKKLYDITKNPHVTKNLLDCEFIKFAGNVAHIANRAPYAQINNDGNYYHKENGVWVKNNGYSHLYGHKLAPDFAGGSVEETREENRADTQATLREVMAARKG